MALDPSIILDGRGPDIMGAMRQGNALARDAMEMRQQADLARLYREHGAGIAGGDQTALNALAGIDPTAAANIMTQNRNNARADEELALRRERYAAQDQRDARASQRQDQEWQLKLAEHARQVGADQAEAQAQQIEDSVKMGLALPDEASWDAMMAREAPDLVGQFANREALAQRYMTAAEILRGGKGGAEYGLTPVYGTDAEGNTVVMQIGKDGSAVRTKIPDGITPDLGVKKYEESRAGAEGKAAGEAAAGLPGVRADAEMVIGAVDDLLNDPYLPEMLGPINSRKPNVSADAARVQSKMDKMGGDAFMQARQLLRGGGTITDYEGKRAEAAMVRMNAAQSFEDYRDALEDFKDAIRVGVMKMEAAAARGELQMPQAAAQSSESTASTGQSMRRRWTPDGGLK